MKVKYKVIAIIFSTMSGYAFSCSCEDYDVDKLYKTSTSIFEGTLKNSYWWHSFTDNAYEFDKIRIFKESERGTPETIWSEKDFLSSCGVDFKEGQSYFVFTYKPIGSTREYTSKCHSWSSSTENENLTKSLVDYEKKVNSRN